MTRAITWVVQELLGTVNDVLLQPSNDLRDVCSRPKEAFIHDYGKNHLACVY